MRETKIMNPLEGTWQSLSSSCILPGSVNSDQGVRRIVIEKGTLGLRLEDWQLP